MPSSTFVNNVWVIVVQKDIVSSTITTSDVAVFQTIGNGLIIDDVIVTTDATGLAGSTALVLKADGRTFFQTAVSGLGATAVKDIKNASVTGSKVSVPAGTKNITVAGTVDVGTGAGIATITLVCRKVDSVSTINPL